MLFAFLASSARRVAHEETSCRSIAWGIQSIWRKKMRFMLKVTIPVESGNAAAKSGKLGATIQSILAELKPEAAYFLDSNGQRSGLIFLDMQDASQIPAIAEPWMLAL